jgi:hypothetical protein
LGLRVGNPSFSSRENPTGVRTLQEDHSKSNDVLNAREVCKFERKKLRCREPTEEAEETSDFYRSVSSSSVLFIPPVSFDSLEKELGVFHAQLRSEGG